jgi:hypothetical protein
MCRCVFAPPPETGHSTTFVCWCVTFYSELALLERPRVVVLDTTFAHHSWDFASQESEPVYNSFMNVACSSAPVLLVAPPLFLVLQISVT